MVVFLLFQSGACLYSIDFHLGDTYFFWLLWGGGGGGSVVTTFECLMLSLLTAIYHNVCDAKMSSITLFHLHDVCNVLYSFWVVMGDLLCSLKNFVNLFENLMCITYILSTLIYLYIYTHTYNGIWLSWCCFNLEHIYIQLIFI